MSNVGHANPAVVRAVQEQAARYMHVMVYGELVETPQVAYATKIASLLPAPLESVYFVNSGAEAVEGALKLAKRFTGRTEMISMRRAYHGSTHGAMSMMGASGGEESGRGAFRPLLPDVQAIEFNDFAQLERITRRTACVLTEPVQGEAGCGLRTRATSKRCGNAATRRCAADLRRDPDRSGAYGRDVCDAEIRRYARHCLPGENFRRGMPLRAFISRHEVMDTLQRDPVLGHITTFGGHPVCCAAGLAALDYLLDNGVVETVEAKGALYECLLRDHPAVREIRRSGLLLAVEPGLFRSGSTASWELFKEAGILSDWFLFCDTAFRISPPLTISGGGGARQRGADPGVPRPAVIRIPARPVRQTGDPFGKGPPVSVFVGGRGSPHQPMPPRRRP